MEAHAENEPQTLDEVLERVRALARRERVRCLWFMSDAGIEVKDEAAARSVLGQIESQCDLLTFKEAGKLRKWLSRASSGTS